MRRRFHLFAVLILDLHNLRSNIAASKVHHLYLISDAELILLEQYDTSVLSYLICSSEINVVSYICI